MLLWLLVSCAASPPATASLRLLNAAVRAPELGATICPEDAGDDCTQRSLPAGRVTTPLTLPAGRHQITIRQDGDVLDSFTYGLGRGGQYTLALYGIVEPPIRLGWETRARQVLGGIDHPAPAGGQLAHRMLSMTPPDPDEPAQVRLVHLSPGAQPIRADLDTGMAHVALPAVSYAEVGAPQRVSRPEGELSLAFEDSPVTLHSQPLSLPSGSITAVYVGALEDTRPVIVVDQVSAP